MRNLLFIAYHFPPLQGSSGIQRTLAFAKYLPQFGWQPHILSTHIRAYPKVRLSDNDLIPSGIEVHRSFALDSRRHLSLGGRYLELLAVPDRWQSWILPGIIQGVRIARAQAVEAICSTYPIASAHVIGYGVSKLTGIPWVADLRDPMLQTGFPSGELRRKTFGAIERLIVRHASRMIVTTPGAAEFYRERYGEQLSGRIAIIENGYDDAAFPQPRALEARSIDRDLQLLHSGLLYGQDRNPSNFFAALSDILQEPEFNQRNVKVILRAPGSELPLDQLIEQFHLGNVVEVKPAAPYREALAEMVAADALIIFQSAACNRQIPAKAYEYLYAGRPIVGMTDPAGDTGRLLASAGIEATAPLEDRAAITRIVRENLRLIRADQAPLPDPVRVAQLSRQARTQELAGLLDGVLHH
ncbi:MAG: glycosyltransferase [Gammaproteobacteria bacterium]